MSSVRSRIDKFEALSRDQDDPDSKNTKRGKRFQFPGSTALNSEADPSEAFISSNRSPKRQGFQNFEADLQEVWSVKKNIHHAGGHKNITSSNSSSGMLNNTSLQVTAGQYSRHGAIPAQPSRGPQVQPAKDQYNRGSTIHGSSEQGAGESRRIPLQDFNSKESAWNVKKGGYSYNQQGSGDGNAKRSIGSPKTQAASLLLPAAKRRTSRTGMDGFRSSAADNTSFQIKNSQHDKVNYAKKMAQGYLRSVGMGEYTPSTSMYSKHQVKNSNSDSSSSASSTPATRWKRVDDDREFEFDI